MAQELECSVDYLINEFDEAVRAPVLCGEGGQRRIHRPSVGPPGERRPPGAYQPTADPAPSGAGALFLEPAPSAAAGTGAPFQQCPATPASITHGVVSSSPPAPGAAATSASAPVGDGIGSGWALVPAAAPWCGAARRHLSKAPLPPNSAGLGGPPSSLPPSYGGQLSAMYSGERLAVNKDCFIIGRGKQSSDLTIKDPNVSRQHAMVESDG